MFTFVVVESSSSLRYIQDSFHTSWDVSFNPSLTVYLFTKEKDWRRPKYINDLKIYTSYYLVKTCFEVLFILVSIIVISSIVQLRNLFSISLFSSILSFNKKWANERQVMKACSKIQFSLSQWQIGYCGPWVIIHYIKFLNKNTLTPNVKHTRT